MVGFEKWLMADDASKDTVVVEQSEEGDVETELSRDMSLFDITFIGVGAMIGAGVFALTGFAAGIAGPALTAAFILNGFVAMFTAVSYAELGAAFPEAGGGYLWVKEALVDPNGFYAGWMSWFAHAVACSLYAVTFGTFLVHLFEYTGLLHFPAFGFGLHFYEKLLAVLMIAAFAYINFRGAEETGKAGIIVTAIKVVILGLFIAFGIWATLQQPNWTAKFLNSPSFAPAGWMGIVGAMGFTYIAFEGYEIIVQSGEEVVDPGTNVPKAVFYSMYIVVPIYVLVAFAAIGGIDVTQQLISTTAIPNSAGSTLPTWEALGYMGELGIISAAGQFVPYGVPLLLFAGLAATMSALNATVYSSSRVSFAMGRDRALPSIFDSIHSGKRTPHWAILISAVIIAVMAVALPIESVAASADIMFILLFVQVNWTVIRMRQTHPDLPRTYTVPYMPWPPLIGIVLQFLLTPFLLLELGLEPGFTGQNSHGFVALVTTAVWMLLGLGIYYGYSKQQEAEQLEEETPTVVSPEPAAEAENQIVVPIANPENAEQLMRTAIDLAKDEETYPNGEILVMSVVTVPQQTPLSEGREFVEDEPDMLDDAMDIAREADVPVSGTIRIGHDVAQAILHAELAANIADSVAYTQDAEVDVIYVVDQGADENDRAEGQEIVDDTIATFREGITVTGEVLEGQDIVDTVIDQSVGYDLVVVGATREGLLDQLVFGAIPEQIGRRAQNTVIMAKRHLGITSRLRRWF